MLVLFETAAGLALFKVLDSGKVTDVDDISKAFSDPETAQKVVKLKAFSKFEDTTEALAAATAVVEGKLGKGLKKFLQKNIVDKSLKDELAVTDSKLGGLVKEKLGIQCIYNENTEEIVRGIRNQLTDLITGLAEGDLKQMQLGLSHSLSRFKLKFSTDKVDTMIIQAIALLDDLDKELNTYSMRVKEWFGWHFPELARIVTDNVQFAKTVKKMKLRPNAADLDFSDILAEEVEAEMKDAAIISMGVEISDEDVINICRLCDQVIDLSSYRHQLSEYLSNRMQAIAPNLTCMVGDMVGARLIGHAGSLINLAKHPASTVQILGAEKALFRALKTKKDTPKYGLIYHASLIGQAQPKYKGKISRVLAAKTALSVRVDALGENTEASIGLDGRAKVEARLRQLEDGGAYVLAATPKAKKTPTKYEKTETPAASYNGDVDMTDSAKKEKKKKRKAEEDEAPAKKQKVENDSDESGKKKKKKKEKDGEKKEKKEKKKKKKSE